MVVLVLRNKDVIIPRGDTLIEKDDVLIMAAPGFFDNTDIELKEIKINKHNQWLNQSIKDIQITPYKLVTIIKRGKRVIIPNGNTVIKENDILVMLN